MEIKINKDLNSYKSKDVAGRFSLKEVGVGVLSGAIAGFFIFALWKVTGEIYPLAFGIVALPIMFLSLGKIQGHSTIAWLKLLKKPLIYKKRY